MNSGVVELSQTTTTDVQKGVSSEQVKVREAAAKIISTATEDYTKEAGRKQATHREKERTQGAR